MDRPETDIRHLRALGSRVIVKRSGQRPTKADPHFYDGRFLRFGGTEKNVVYFDKHTQATRKSCKALQSG